MVKLQTGKNACVLQCLILKPVFFLICVDDLTNNLISDVKRFADGVAHYFQSFMIPGHWHVQSFLGIPVTSGWLKLLILARLDIWTIMKNGKLTLPSVNVNWESRNRLPLGKNHHIHNIRKFPTYSQI